MSVKTCDNCRRQSEHGKRGLVGTEYAGHWYCSQCWKLWDADHQDDWRKAKASPAEVSTLVQVSKSKAYTPVAKAKDTIAEARALAALRKAERQRTSAAQKLQTEGNRAVLFWGIVDLKYDADRPQGDRIRVLELGDGSTSGFSQHGRHIRDEYAKTYFLDANPLRCAVLVENKKLTHDRFAREGFLHLRPSTGFYERQYTADLAKKIVSDLASSGDVDALVLKLCNRSHGAGVVVVPVPRLDEALKRLLIPPSMDELSLLFETEGSKQSDLPFLEESCRHWWSNECPTFLVEVCCRSTCVEAPGREGNGQVFDGTMRVSFVICRCDATDEDKKIDGLLVQWIGGYWKLPRASYSQILGDDALDAVNAKIVSSFHSQDKLTASVAEQSLRDVYSQLTPALQQVFQTHSNNSKRIIQEYREEPLFCAFVLTRLAAVMRVSKMEAAVSLMKEAQMIVLTRGDTLNDERRSVAESAVLSYIERSMASSYVMQAKWEDARRIAESSIKTFPTNASAYYIMGVIERQAKDTLAAESNASRAVAMDPEFKEAYLLLSSCQLELGDLDEAVKTGRACLQRFDSPTAHFTLGQALYRMAWVYNGEVAESLVSATCKDAAYSLQEAKSRMPDVWTSSYEEMLQYVSASREKKANFAKQPVSTWQVHAWRP